MLNLELYRATLAEDEVLIGDAIIETLPLIGAIYTLMPSACRF